MSKKSKKADSAATSAAKPEPTTEASVSRVEPCDPLVAIDKILHDLSQIRNAPTDAIPTDLVVAFAQAILRSKDVAPGLYASDPIAALFAQELDRGAQRFVGVCLLRLLSSNDSCFQRDDFRIKAYRVFDTVFAEDVYRELGIETKDQTFQKESKLRSIVTQTEAKLRSLIQSLSSLEAVRHFRHDLMRGINAELTKALVWPFLPRSLVDHRLHDLFRAIQEYSEAASNKKFDAYQKSKSLLDRYRMDAIQRPTRYACEYLESLAVDLLRLLTIDFANNPLSQPANVVVQIPEKKYPLSQRGKRFPIVLGVLNKGPGHASNVGLRFEATDDIKVEKAHLYLGDLEPSAPVGDVEFPCEIIEPQGIALACLEISWTDFDNSVKTERIDLELQSQRTDIDWERLQSEGPYSLAPVTTQDDLVGRTEVLNKLTAGVLSKSVGSFYVYGQKRVGKTSLVCTLETRLHASHPQVLPIYLLSGDYTDPDPAKTVARLGRKLCERMQEADSRLAGISIPSFENALSPLTDFLGNVVKFAPDRRILFILDEFDELPVSLYECNSVADAFFLTVRSISGKEPFGFILVGGEKMGLVMSRQGGKLNNFDEVRIDYFHRDSHWADFSDLVRRPVSRSLEVSDDALKALYDESAGNPYFTKFICDKLYKMMVNRRDCHVTRKEVTEATRDAVGAAKSHRFQHFWEDGIIETGERAEDIKRIRRKVLIALSETLRQGQPTREGIEKEAAKDSLSAVIVNAELREFERRHVLEIQDSRFRCKVHLFEEWLKQGGVNEIIGSDAIFEHRQAEEKIRITSEEIVEITERWGNYKARRITEDYVRVWLHQFGGNSDQRLMLQLLQKLRFINDDEVRAKLNDAHGIMTRGIVRRLESGKRKRTDVLVTYLENSPAKSGAYYAKRYSDENEIYYENVVARSQLLNRLAKHQRNQSLQALVFIDDFVGTGNSAAEYFARLADECGEAIQKSGLQTFFIAICGFQTGQARVEEELEKLKLPVKVHLCIPLDDGDKCFSENSRIFPNPSERHRARDICHRLGQRLEKHGPLGYGDCQAAVVFESTCPNNSLPILWAEDKDWSALFRR